MEVTIPTDLKGQKELVERIAASPLLSRSARLRDLFLYLCARVLDDGASDIHELEVGHRVFGREAHYDTIADNIVRVHASMLRKRLAEYFEHEGRDEDWMIQIPRGNYAPQFVERVPARRQQPRLEISVAENAPAASQPDPASLPAPVAALPWRGAWAPLVASLLAVLFCGLSIYLWVNSRAARQAYPDPFAGQPDVRQFWAGLFPQNGSAEVVLDDTSLDFFQQATGQPVSLAEYFDRSYLRSVQKNVAASRFDPALAYSLMLRRQSSYSYTTLMWTMAQIAAALHCSARPEFARDLTFRQVKAGNVVLLGDPQSNPWIQPFEPRVSIDWIMDPGLHVYYPRDKNAPESERDQFRPVGDDTNPRAGYATVAFLPNLSGTGNALLLTATGGSAMGVAMDFLNDEASMRALRARLHQNRGSGFPYFEALLKTARGSKELNSAQILISRPAGISSMHAQ